uniref:Putative secreted protein n=1 Tax=Ixodes scapularis TaxID=6945 RepID=A0A4D5S5N1_IXOSC
MVRSLWCPLVGALVLDTRCAKDIFHNTCPSYHVFNPNFRHFKEIRLRSLHSALLLAHITCRSSKLQEHKVQDYSSGKALTEFGTKGWRRSSREPP